MKNRLLATLLILTAVPFFANGATIKKPTKAELLTHLKNIKTKFLDNLLPMPEDREYIFVITLMNELYEQSEPLQQYISNRTNHDFDLIYNHMAPFARLFYIEISQNDYFHTPDAMEKLYKLFEPIYTKLHKKYCLENPNGKLVDITTDETFAFEIKIFLDGFIIPHALIKKIDAKIAELEAQR